MGDGYVVTWAIGHLVALAEPGQMRPEWQSWRRDRLPILPESWPLVVQERVKEQFEAVRRVLNDPRVNEVVCATDAGREGELIFRQLYEAAGCTKPVRRLWISSLTPEAIRDGLARLRPAREYDRLADAARGRSRADWLVGMNFSRAFTLATDEKLSVGRVQTPTLAMLVERELAIRAFVPEEYLEVVATFEGETGRYPGTWFDPAQKEDGGKRLPKDGADAAAIVARVKAAPAAIESVESQDAPHAAAPPLRPDRAAAPREPPPRLEREEDARGRAAPLRGEEGDHLPADRQPAPLARRGGDAAAGDPGARAGVRDALRGGDRGAAARPHGSSTTRR